MLRIHSATKNLLFLDRKRAKQILHFVQDDAMRQIRYYDTACSRKVTIRASAC